MSHLLGPGILSDLKYSEALHSWALELGSYLAVYVIVQSAPDWPAFAVKLSQVTDHINYLLSTNSIPSSVPEQIEGRQRLHDLERVLTKIREYVERLVSREHFTFLLIGEAASFLRYAMEFKDQDPRFDENLLRALADDRIRRTRMVLHTDEREGLGNMLTSLPHDQLIMRAINELLLDLQKPLTILLISADPTDQSHLRLGAELRYLWESLDMTRFRDRFRIEEIISCRPRDISRALDRFEPSILHFSGHGSTTGLIFEEEVGNSQIVEQKSLATLLGHQRGLQLVIMNACYAQLIADKVGHVIGMRSVVQDKDAIAFTRAFYSSLGYGRSIQVAFDKATAAVGTDGLSMLEPVLLNKRPGEEV